MRGLYFFHICFVFISFALCPDLKTLGDEAREPATRTLRPEIAVQMGHSATVTALAVSPDGKTIATGSEDNTVKLWESTTGELRRSLRHLQGTVASVDFSPVGDTVVAIGWDGQACLWDVESGALLHQWSDPGAYLVFFAADSWHLWTGNAAGQVKEWNVRAGRVTRTLINHKFGPGLLVYNRSLNLFASALDKQFCLWDGRSGTLRKSFQTSFSVNAMAFSPQGTSLAVGLSDKTMQLWATDTGTRQTTFPVEPQPILRLSYAPDGKTIAIATALSVRLRDAKTGRLVGKISHNLRLTDMAFTPDSKYLVRGSDDKTALLWDTRTGRRRQVFGRAATLWSLALAPDGKMLAAASEDHAVFLWDVVTGELTRTLQQAGGVSAVAFSPDGRILASSSLVSPEVQLWNVASGEKLSSLIGHKNSVRSLAFSPDGRTLASGSTDNTVRLWSVEKGTTLHVLSGHEKSVMSLTFSPDSAMIASASADKTIKCWDVSSGHLTKTLAGHRAPVYSVAFSPQGDLLASNSFDKTLRLWDVKSGGLQRLIQIKLAGTAVCFSPDGKSVLGNGRGAIFVWDTQSGKLKQTLQGHESYVFSFAFLPDGNMLASAGEDQIKLWDVKKSRLLASLVVLPSPNLEPQQNSSASKALTADARLMDGLELLAGRDYLAVTEQGYYKGSAQADRFVKFRLGNELYPAECFQAHYYRPDLVRRVLAGQEVPSPGAFKGARPPIAHLEKLAPSTTNDAYNEREFASLTVQVGDDSAVQRVEFLVNGARSEARPLVADSRPLTSDSRVLNSPELLPETHRVRRRFSVQLPLPPQDSTVKVQAVAFDEDGLQSQRAELTLVRPPLPLVAGNLLGLCVGVSRHVDERLNLRFPRSDALALAAAFQKPSALYRTARIQTLIDEQAMSANVIAALEQLVAQSSRADTVLLSLSGHGWRDAKGVFYFATHEVNRNNVENTALRWDIVVQRLAQLAQKSRRVMVLLDACHSGSAATNDELVKAALGANTGVMFFASSKGSELSLENAEWGNGVFTKAVLEALQGRAKIEKEKSLSTLDFMAFVARRVKTLTGDRQHPNVPYLQDFDTDGAFISNP